MTQDFTGQPGVYDLPNNTYHSGPGISKSGLDKIHRCPAWFRHCLDNPPEQTAAMRLGSAVHTAVLEPEKFDAEFVVAPVVDKRTKKGKEQWAEFCEASAGKDVLTGQEGETIQRIRDAVFAHPAARACLQVPGQAEKSVFWRDSATDELCKCRPDWWRNDGIIVDLKTTRDAAPESFSKSAYQYRYHVQAGYYMDGLELATGERPRGFVFIAVETAPPYLVSVYAADDQMVLFGQVQYRKDLDLYAQCKAKNMWPGFPEEVLSLHLPPWAKRDFEADF
jgi:exodeoxyribonuclease VIII